MALWRGLPGGAGKAASSRVNSMVLRCPPHSGGAALEERKGHDVPIPSSLWRALPGGAGETRN
eukprot:3417905-Pyramimonas_sp.AAC.1